LQTSSKTLFKFELEIMGKSHFAIDQGVLTAIRQLVPKGGRVIEVGSGDGTEKLAERYEVYSIEDNEEWVGHCTDSKYIHAPLVELMNQSTPYSWYDPSVLEKELPASCDLILVDGPAGSENRQGLLWHLELFPLDAHIIVDDTLRDSECKLAREIAYLLNRPLHMFWNFCVIPTKPLTPLRVARIQRQCLRILEKESSLYLESYFTQITPVIPIDSTRWHEHEISLNLTLHKKMEELQTKHNNAERQLNMIQSSWSYRLGRILLLPLKPIYLINKRIRR